MRKRKVGKARRKKQTTDNKSRGDLSEKQSKLEGGPESKKINLKVAVERWRL